MACAYPIRSRLLRLAEERPARRARQRRRWHRVTTPAPFPQRTPARRASTILGVVLALVAGGFVAHTVVRDRRQLGDTLSGASPGWMAVAVVLAVVGMTAIAIPWRYAIRSVGEDLPLSQVIARYYVGEIGKYVPGGVWSILGRAELATRWGIPRPAAYGSVLLSLITLYLAAMTMVVMALPALWGSEDAAALVVVALLPVGLGALHPAVLQRTQALVERVIRHPVDFVIPAWGRSVSLVFRYVPAWVAIGGATWAVARALDPQAPLLQVAAAAVLSWVVGFVLVPVPGGLGVREAVFVAAAGSLDPGVAAAVALAARLVFVLVDAVGAVIGSLALRRSAVH
ncbi:MAG: flippase-like domain-containing protein [Acidimicrobiia bacterium]|nr:flippase-like domain-containing protein [Acidimicrobiia bacterium]